MTTDILVIAGVTVIVAFIGLIVVFFNSRGGHSRPNSNTSNLRVNSMGRKKKPQQAKVEAIPTTSTSESIPEPVSQPEAQKEEPIAPPVETIAKERCFPEKQSVEAEVTSSQQDSVTVSTAASDGKKNKKKNKKGGGNQVEEVVPISKEEILSKKEVCSLKKENSPTIKDQSSAKKEKSPTKKENPSVAPAVTPANESSNEALRLAETRVTELNARVTQLTNQITQEQTKKSSEVDTCRSEVTDLKKKLSEAHKIQKEEQQKSLKSSTVERELNQRCSRLENELASLQKKFDASVKECGELTNKAKVTEAALLKFEKQANEYKSNDTAVKDFEKRLKEKDAAINTLETDLNKLTEEIESQREKNNTLRERNWLLVEQLAPKAEETSSGPQPAGNNSKGSNKGGKDLQKSLNAANKEIESLKAAKHELEDRLKKSSKESSVSSSGGGNGEPDESVNHLKGQINALRREKDQLSRQLKDGNNTGGGGGGGGKKSGKKSKVVNGNDNIQTEMTTLKTKIIELQNSNDELKSSLQSAQEASTVGAGGERKGERKTHEVQEELRNANVRLWTAESERSRLERVLQDTEDMLSRLQNAVNEEEGRWKEALEASEKEAEQARSELQRVFVQINQVQGNPEMETKIHDLEDGVASLTKERDNLKKELANNQQKHSRNTKKGKSHS